MLERLIVPKSKSTRPTLMFEDDAPLALRDREFPDENMRSRPAAALLTEPSFTLDPPIAA